MFYAHTNTTHFLKHLQTVPRKFRWNLHRPFHRLNQKTLQIRRSKNALHLNIYFHSRNHSFSSCEGSRRVQRWPENGGILKLPKNLQSQKSLNSACEFVQSQKFDDGHQVQWSLGFSGIISRSWIYFFFCDSLVFF